jgi:G6PDH family F420-dependent oxidoreductase
MRIGYFLSCEEFGPAELLEQAVRAERAGFHGLWISDHFHPWNDTQGHSPFVWSVIGALSSMTRLPVTTAVTCPTIRTHPAIIAQAAATSAVMLEGRFNLGVGTGEALNEHVLGTHWPEADVRLEMLEEAVEVIRKLWEGGQRSHRGRHYTVENARIYTLPDQLPPIYVSAYGPKAMEVAGRIADGYVGTMPDRELLELYDACGGTGPKIGGIKVCVDQDADRARKLAHALWPTVGVPGELGQELPTPAHFEQAASKVTVEEVASSIPCGADPDQHLRAIREQAEAGYDEVYVQQIGPDQEAFFRFYEQQVLPRL